MTRVWFNHWFSTVYHLIQLMKQDEELQVYVIGTNKQQNSVIRQVCDEWYEEFESEGEQYVEDCLNFCLKHQVDVFVPRRRMTLISQYKEEFAQIGVKVVVEEYEIMRLVNDKASAYRELSKIEGLAIPEFYIVNTVEEFRRAYETLKDKYPRVCMKFVEDEGGMSFRTITEDKDRFNRLRIYQGSSMLYEDVCDILAEKETFPDYMVMPYLEGEEISVDCLNTKDGLIAIPRVKGPARHERVVYDQHILQMVTDIMTRTDLQYPCNIQFKLSGGVPYLLEINTRMSGGLMMSCLAAGVNIPNIALNKLLGKQVPWTVDRAEKLVSYIEKPEIL